MFKFRSFESCGVCPVSKKNRVDRTDAIDADLAVFFEGTPFRYGIGPDVPKWKADVVDVDLMVKYFRHFVSHRKGHDGIDGPIDIRKVEFLIKLLHDLVHLSIQLFPRRVCCPGLAVSGNTQPAYQRFEADSQRHACAIAPRALESDSSGHRFDPALLP